MGSPAPQGWSIDRLTERLGGLELSTQQECSQESYQTRLDRVHQQQPDKENTDNDQGQISPRRLNCFKQLREELTCAVCLDICVRPCTTPCGHNYCRSCLRRNLELNCPCPKCRAKIPPGFVLTVNTTLWNTIQHLFPAEASSKPLTPLQPLAEAGERHHAAARYAESVPSAGNPAAAPFRPPRPLAAAASTTQHHHQRGALTGTSSSRANTAAATGGDQDPALRSLSGPRPQRQAPASFYGPVTTGGSHQGSALRSLSGPRPQRQAPASFLSMVTETTDALRRSADASAGPPALASSGAAALYFPSGLAELGVRSSVPRGTSAASRRDVLQLRSTERRGGAPASAAAGAERQEWRALQQLETDEPSLLMQLLAGDAPARAGSTVVLRPAPSAPQPTETAAAAVAAVSSCMNPFMRALRPVQVRPATWSAAPSVSAATPDTAAMANPPSSAAAGFTASQRAMMGGNRLRLANSVPSLGRGSGVGSSSIGGGLSSSACDTPRVPADMSGIDLLRSQAPTTLSSSPAAAAACASAMAAPVSTVRQPSHRHASSTSVNADGLSDCGGWVGAEDVGLGDLDGELASSGADLDSLAGDQAAAFSCLRTTSWTTTRSGASSSGPGGAAAVASSGGRRDGAPAELHRSAATSHCYFVATTPTAAGMCRTRGILPDGPVGRRLGPPSCGGASTDRAAASAAPAVSAQLALPRLGLELPTSVRLYGSGIRVTEDMAEVQREVVLDSPEQPTLASVDGRDGVTLPPAGGDGLSDDVEWPSTEVASAGATSPSWSQLDALMSRALEPIVISPPSLPRLRVPGRNGSLPDATAAVPTPAAVAPLALPAAEPEALRAQGPGIGLISAQMQPVGGLASAVVRSGDVSLDPDLPDNYDGDDPAAADTFFTSPFFDCTMLWDTLGRQTGAGAVADGGGEVALDVEGRIDGDDVEGRGRRPGSEVGFSPTWVAAAEAATRRFQRTNSASVLLGSSNKRENEETAADQPGLGASVAAWVGRVSEPPVGAYSLAGLKLRLGDGGIQADPASLASADPCARPGQACSGDRMNPGGALPPPPLPCLRLPARALPSGRAEQDVGSRDCPIDLLSDSSDEEQEEFLEEGRVSQNPAAREGHSHGPRPRAAAGRVVPGLRRPQRK